MWKDNEVTVPTATPASSLYGEPLVRHTTRRLCIDCEKTRLSIYNSGTTCRLCQRKDLIEVPLAKIMAQAKEKKYPAKDNPRRAFQRAFQIINRSFRVTREQLKTTGLKDENVLGARVTFLCVLSCCKGLPDARIVKELGREPHAASPLYRKAKELWYESGDFRVNCKRAFAEFFKK